MYLTAVEVGSAMSSPALRRLASLLPRGLLRTNERGQALVVAGLMMVPLIGAVGVALDYGYGAVEQRNAQAAADAAALAGAIDLPSYPSAVQGNAVSVASSNGFTNGVDGVTITATNPPTSGPRSGDLKSVEVNVSRCSTRDSCGF